MSKFYSLYFANRVASSSYDFDKSYEEKEEEQYTKSNTFEAMLQTILDRVTTTGENAQGLHKYYEVFERENVKAKELGKDIILVNSQPCSFPKIRFFKKRNQAMMIRLVVKIPY